MTNKLTGKELLEMNNRVRSWKLTDRCDTCGYAHIDDKGGYVVDYDGFLAAIKQAEEEFGKQ